MITDDEKIRKAHEIYYKRNGIKYRSEDTIKGKGTSKLLILTIIIVVILGYQNQNIILKKNWLNEIKSFLNTKIDIKEIFTNEKSKNVSNEIKEVKTEEQVSQIKEVQEETKYEIIWPYKGEITSGYGIRESANENINGNHTGIDIAGNYGENIVSAIDGKVIEVSEEGKLGKHIKIENKKYTTIYAHCSEIIKSEGEEVKQGDIIAQVGSTGNSTRKSPAF